MLAVPVTQRENGGQPVGLDLRMNDAHRNYDAGFAFEQDLFINQAINFGFFKFGLAPAGYSSN